MIIVIDAYNYIKSVAGQTFIDDRTAQQWIDIFKEYVRVRHNPIILIFDAGPGYYPSTQRHGGVTVMYAGQQQTADDVIKVWLKAHPGADALLVSSDRELCHCADDARVASVGSYDFYKIFNHVMKQEQEFEQKVTQTVHKTGDLSSSLSLPRRVGHSSKATAEGSSNKNSSEQNQGLDQLEDLDRIMEEGSRGLMKGKIIKEHDAPPRVRGGKKVSKPDKHLMRKIDKI
ncbi:MAG: NYN domain-containing protein [Candidatus Babeliales bacterium]|jgi:predicted RNA-binding protein with PIN domain